MPRKRKSHGISPAKQAEIDRQIARMREMLRLMAPETGSAALGAIRRAFPDSSLSNRMLALKDFR